MNLLIAPFNTLVPRVKRFLQVLFLLIVISFSPNILKAQNSQTFTVGSIEAKSGEKVSGSLIVEKGDDKDTFIPITIINGAKKGPVLTLNAGTHGTEYVSVVALQKILKEIDPKELSGTLILVHIANIPAFFSRSVYISPVDNKNLNHVFPGKKEGTISERIAYTITHEIIAKSDYLIDMHSGEFCHNLPYYSYFVYRSTDDEVSKKSLVIARAFGNKYLFPLKHTEIDDTIQATCLDAVAFRRDIGTIVTELGGQGIVTSSDVEIATKGIKNVMQTIGMFPGEPIIYNHHVYLTESRNINSNYNGIYYPLVEKEQYVKKGTLLGYTTDYWGNILEEYYMPFSGLIASFTIGPVIIKGESVVYIAKINDKFED
ncbi:succinylglutamate desuccinylase/aspartoacylase family protein [Bacteroidota bacterium]